MANARAAMTAKHAGAWKWPATVVGLLVAQVALGAATAYLAVRDPAHTVTPGYHAKALAWEGEALRRRKSDALGWRASAEFAQREGGAVLRAMLRDRRGAPVDGAHVTATAFHHARGRDATTVDLLAVGGGAYEAPITAERAGVWEIRLDAARGDQEFHWTDVRERDPGSER
jgi:nitrogen fixation protein FixH